VTKTRSVSGGGLILPAAAGSGQPVHRSSSLSGSFGGIDFSEYAQVAVGPGWLALPRSWTMIGF
jgi:hypothetical protein